MTIYWKTKFFKKWKSPCIESLKDQMDSSSGAGIRGNFCRESESEIFQKVKVKIDSSRDSKRRFQRRYDFVMWL